MLSVCLITLNEESSIAAALQSVAPVADEIIVVDTGSSDRTRDIARQFTPHVFDFPWSNDFSAPRNFAASKVTHDWAFVLDADEELLPESHEELRLCLTRDDALGFTVLRENLTDPTRLDYFTENRVLRLMRFYPDVRFVGRIHEHLRPTPEQLIKRENKKILHSTIRLRHFGYTADRHDHKLHRSVHLLKLELDERPGQFDYLVEYGRTLLQLHDPQGHPTLGRALQQLHNRRHDPAPPHPLAAALLEYLLTTPSNLIEGPMFPQDAFPLIERWFPSSPPLLWLAANTHFSNSRFLEAARLLERLLELARSSTYDRSIPFNPRILGPDALLNLGACYFRLADLDKAQRTFRLLLQDPTHHTAAEQNLALIQQVRVGKS